MSKIKIYGIKSCDTMKKAMTWLTEHDVEFEFHDYKKQGIDQQTLSDWLQQKPWDQLINRRGTTWRKLTDSDKADIDDAKAISLMMNNTSLIKRPVLDLSGQIHLGFKDTEYDALFS